VVNTSVPCSVHEFTEAALSTRAITALGYLTETIAGRRATANMVTPVLDVEEGPPTETGVTLHALTSPRRHSVSPISDIHKCLKRAASARSTSFTSARFMARPRIRPRRFRHPADS
jgi:hypothetical protein